MRGKTLGLVAAVALGACGLIDPRAPPARVIGSAPGVPGAAMPDPGGSSDVVGLPPFPGYSLAWHDEFDGGALDETRWKIDEGPNRDGVSARDSIVVKGGVLSLVTFTASPGVHHAGHINTLGKFEPRYGYLEARVRFRDAARYLDSAGQWCSFFLWPKTYGNPPGNPGAAGVEIDIFEHRDSDKAGFRLSDMVSLGVNWDSSDDRRVVAHPAGAPLANTWHTYAVLWTGSEYTFYIDEVPVFMTSKAMSYQPEPIYLCCEVLNGEWDGYIPAGGYGARDVSVTGMDVDWIRVWQAR